MLARGADAEHRALLTPLAACTGVAPWEMQGR